MQLLEALASDDDVRHVLRWLGGLVILRGGYVEKRLRWPTKKRKTVHSSEEIHAHSGQLSHAHGYLPRCLLVRVFLGEDDVVVVMLLLS